MQDPIKTSAGIVIVYKNKILLCHPTSKNYYKTYTPPKGGINNGESIKSAAIREVMEETGIEVSPDKITKDPFEIEYINYKENKIYKIVFLYIYKIEKLSDIKMTSETVPSEQLQKEEIDWAGFLDEEEAKGKLLKHYKDIFKKIYD